MITAPFARLDLGARPPWRGLAGGVRKEAAASADTGQLGDGEKRDPRHEA